MMIRHLCINHQHVQVLDLHLLQSWHHTRHGLHINKKGKKHISQEILKMTMSGTRAVTIQSLTSNTTPNEIVPESIMCDTSKYTVHETSNSHEESSGRKTSIDIIESDMTDVISTFEEQSTVAFAHCISGDFDDNRQMSAGVAVAFRKKFGRPNRSDCVNDFLTVQQLEGQATIYGLVTKPTFSNKPSTQNYDKAFSSLIQDFKERKLKTLICSPMGCMRDLISPQHFAANITNFHHKTGAAVTIVVKDERASRTLRHGLKHEEFVNQLRSCITTELSRIDLEAGAPGDLTSQTPPTPVTLESLLPYPPSAEVSARVSSGDITSEKVVAVIDTSDVGVESESHGLSSVISSFSLFDQSEINESDNVFLV